MATCIDVEAARKVSDPRLRHDSNGSWILELDTMAQVDVFRREISETDSWATGDSKLGATECIARTLGGRPTKRIQQKYLKTLATLKAANPDRVTRAAKLSRQRTWGEDGADLDMDRLLGGSPDYWVQCKKRKRGAPAVTMFLNQSLSGTTSQDVFVEMAAKAAALATRLEARGMTVRILTGFITSSMSEWSRTRKAKFGAVAVECKPFGRPLDVGRLLVAGMPALLRLWGLGILHAVTDCGNGYACRPDEALLDALGVDVCINQDLDLAEAERRILATGRARD